MSNQNQNQSLVYFFGKSTFGDTNPDFIKIGYTSTELLLRRAALQTGSESPIWAMGVLPYDTEEEARREEDRIQEHFGGFRARGEWFYATPRIIQYIENYAIQYTELLIEEVSPNSDTENVKPDAPSTRSEEAIAYGNWLRNCMTEHQIDDDGLAKRVGCTAGYIRYLKNGWGMPGKELHNALTDSFGNPTDSDLRMESMILAVKMNDGTWIAEDKAINTFIQVIKAVGIEEVKNLSLTVNGIPLIADCNYEAKAQKIVETDERTYYIVSGTNTVTKENILNDISNQLQLNITVIANPRV